MKARQKLPASQQKMIEQEVARTCREQFFKQQRLGAYRMALIFLHTLRFEFGWKQRLLVLFVKILEKSADIDKWKEADVMAEVYLKELEESGCNFNGAFDELIEYEREVYQMKRDKEQAIREARAKG